MSGLFQDSDDEIEVPVPAPSTAVPDAHQENNEETSAETTDHPAPEAAESLAVDEQFDQQQVPLPMESVPLTAEIVVPPSQSVGIADTAAAATTTATATIPPIYPNYASAPAPAPASASGSGNSGPISVEAVEKYIAARIQTFITLNKTKELAAAIQTLVFSQTEDVQSTANLPEEFETEKVEFWNVLEQALSSGPVIPTRAFPPERSSVAEDDDEPGAGAMAGRQTRTELIHHIMRLLRDIREVDLIKKFVEPLLLNTKDKGKKNIKMMADLKDLIHKFLERLVPEANIEFLQQDMASPKFALMRSYFASLNEMLNEKAHFDLIWYANHLNGEAFLILDIFDAAINRALNCEYTNKLQLDPKLAKSCQKSVSSNLSKVVKEIEVNHKLHKAFLKSGMDRGVVCAQMGLTKTYQQIVDVMSGSALVNLPEKEREAFLETLNRKKDEYVNKRREALQQIRMRDKLLLERVQEAAIKMKTQYDALIAQVQQQQQRADPEELIREYCDINCQEVFENGLIEQYVNRAIVFNNIASGLFGTVFKGPEGDGHWDTSSFVKEIKREAEWKSVFKTFEAIEDKILKKFGLVHSLDSVTYGYYSSGDDELVNYLQQRNLLYPYALACKPPAAIPSDLPEEQRMLSNAICKIVGHRIHRFNVKVERELDNGQTVEVPISESWPSMVVSFMGVEDPWGAIWVNGKCSLSIVNFKGVLP